ncbi:penicillin-binding protein [Methylobacterium sp. E-041]|uniref:penicillin-binding protein n=1 Tax=Methylobacterium sp. E-041 TaxID=2836573 RepID=UPI001FB8A69C|nr:penicillin-binding protein [Methylobacterium sp. E-041]MCJ2108123.1 penicillin-binding protein [Methylobacterium sp. E-041]
MAELSRRIVLGAFLVVVASRMPAAASDGVLPAIRWAEAADAAYLGSGRIAADRAKAGLPLSAGWAAYRGSLARVRRLARLDLYALTPTTAESAKALAAYHTARGERAGSAGARRAARRRLRKVFARPGAVLPPRLT